MFDLGLGVTLTALTPSLQYEEIDLLRDSSIRTFELNPAVFATDYDHAIRRAFREMLRETGKKAISYHIPFSRLDDLSWPEETIRQRALSRFRALLQEAAYFNAELIVLHPSTEPIDQDKREEHIALLRQSMNEIEAELKAAGMRVALEFLPRMCMGNTLADIEIMVDGFSDTFGVCLDVNHLMAQYREIPAMIASLGSRLIPLHISDYDGVDERHWLPGTGVIDWKNVIAALRNIGYRGPFNYEIKRNDEIEFAARISGLEENYDWMTSQ